MSSNLLELPPFVQRHIDAIARSEGFEKYKVENHAGSKSGEGLMSNMLAVTLREENTDKQLTLICKLQLPRPESTEVMDSSPLFEREVEMYKTVLPLMEKLQRDHGLTIDHSFKAYPKCWVAEFSDNNESIIILENIRPHGYALWNKMVPFPFEHVALLMQQLGRYHALSFVLRDQQPQVFSQLETFSDVFVGLLMNDSIKSMFSGAITMAIETMDEEKDKELMRSIREKWVDLVLTRQNADRLKRFGVLIHGDCHTNNLMFRTKNGIADSIMLIDWQTSVVASPAIDLGNFLLWCAEKPLRDQHLDELLGIYHTELTRVVNACGSDAKALFSYDDLLDQMREFGINAVSYSPIGVSIMVTESKDMGQIADLSAASDGVDDVTVKTVAPLNDKTEERYKKRLLDIVQDARRLGYISE